MLTMKRHLLLIAILGAVLSAGCVQRTITINSDPDGALAYLNDTEVGRTPVTVPFTFYGTYSVRLEKEGYQTLNTTQKAEAPLWENPGPDLIAELLPGERRVELVWDFALDPLTPTDPKGLIDRARQLRASLNPSSEVQTQADEDTDTDTDAEAKDEEDAAEETKPAK